MNKLFNKLLNWRYTKFALVGCVGTLVGAGTLYCLTEYAGLYYMMSYIASAIVGSIVNYQLNLHWTWGDKKK